MYLQYYLEQLDYSNLPNFLIKYLKNSIFIEVKKYWLFLWNGLCFKRYICDFREYISRYDHSLTVCLIVYKLTKDKKATLAGLFMI